MQIICKIGCVYLLRRSPPEYLFLSSSSPNLRIKLRPFSALHPRPPLPALIEQWKLLSSRIPKDSSDSRTAIVPSEDPASASSQLDVVLNCQLFTQAITEAVILCKYSR